MREKQRTKESPTSVFSLTTLILRPLRLKKSYVVESEHYVFYLILF